MLDAALIIDIVCNIWDKITWAKNIRAIYLRQIFRLSMATGQNEKSGVDQITRVTFSFPVSSHFL